MSNHRDFTRREMLKAASLGTLAPALVARSEAAPMLQRSLSLTAFEPRMTAQGRAIGWRPTSASIPNRDTARRGSRDSSRGRASSRANR